MHLASHATCKMLSGLLFPCANAASTRNSRTVIPDFRSVELGTFTMLIFTEVLPLVSKLSCSIFFSKGNIILLLASLISICLFQH